MQLKKNKIILITRRFPYFTTEAFIESEIEYLGTTFDEVIIFPLEIGDYKRALPPNVSVNNDFSVVFQNKTGRGIKTIFSLDFYKAIIDHKRKINKFSDIFLIFKFMSSLIIYRDFFTKRKEIRDVKLIYSYWLNEVPLALSQVKENLGIDLKLVSRAHRYDIYEGTSSTQSFWPYKQKTIEALDCIYSISQNGKEYLEKQYPTIFSNIIVSKLGVRDRSAYAKSSAKGKFEIVSVSRVHAMKRVDFIFESICAFAKSVPEISIVWTHFGDGPGLANIKKIAGSIKIQNVNFVFNGNVSNESIYEHYASAAVDLFVNLSSSEGIPVSIMEAQSFGIPVVATNVGGSGEIVVAETGILLSNHPSISDVVNAYTLIALDDKFDKKIIKEYWNSNFNAEINYSRFAESLNNLIL